MSEPTSPQPSQPSRDDAPVPSREQNLDDVSINEIIDTVTGYAKQETLGPLKGAGRWLGFGAAAALSLSLGLIFVLVGLLRLLQTEWDRSASGSLSWLAYLITLAAAGVILALTVSRIKKSTLGNEPT